VKFFAYLWGYGDTVMARVFAEQYPDRKGWQALLHYVRRDYKRALDIRRQDTPGAWQRSLSSLYLSGRLEEARAFADTIRRELVKTSGESRTATERSFYRAKLGLANAFAGEIEVAVREATAALDLYPEATDEQNRELMVANVYRTYILAGEYEAAIDQLEFLLSTPSTFTMARLRLDPFYEPLRDHPRFQALLDKYE
jgi:serine/threonine-protein kinase